MNIVCVGCGERFAELEEFTVHANDVHGAATVNIRERNRMTREEARDADVAPFTPKQWENKVRQLLVEAKNAGTITGWWRDKDRATPAENRRRMKGKLDFEVWVSIDSASRVSSMHRQLLRTIPRWKVDAIGEALMGTPYVSFTIDIECKTGGGVANEAQLQTIERSNRNPGRHAFLVYPPDLPWLRKVLGI